LFTSIAIAQANKKKRKARRETEKKLRSRQIMTRQPMVDGGMSRNSVRYQELWQLNLEIDVT